MAVQIILAALLLAAAAYAQLGIGALTAGRSKVVLTRSVFAAVGIAMGYVASRYAGEGAAAWLAFVQGFGIVHVPAAIILVLKRARRERPS
jgi:hypothetical protein